METMDYTELLNEIISLNTDLINLTSEFLIFQKINALLILFLSGLVLGIAVVIILKGVDF